MIINYLRAQAELINFLKEILHVSVRPFVLNLVGGSFRIQ